MNPLSITALLKKYPFSVNAQTILNALENCGVIERVEYLSTTGSGELKEFRAIKNDSYHLGINEKSSVHPVKTTPKFYEEQFLNIMKIVSNQIKKEVEEAIG